MASTATTTGEEEAREQGRLDAEAFDLKLRHRELREREQRLVELAWKPRSPAADQGWKDDEAAAAVARLETRIHELTHYLRAVESSRPWRAIQWLRRLVGRAW